MPNNLPLNWCECKLEDFCYINLGQSPSSDTYNNDKKGIPFFQGKADFGRTYPTVRCWCSSPNKIAEEGDVLLSVRAPVGAVNIANEKCCIGRGLAALRGLDAIKNKFMYYLILAYERELHKQETGTTFAAITGNALKNIDILLPPLAEQERIVAKIEALFQDIDEGVERLKLARAQKGLKKSSKRRNKDKKETKADIIAKLYPHLGPRQIRDFQKLELNDIWEAIKHSFSTGQDLTRSMALSMHIKRATKDSNNSNISQYASLRVWRAKEEDFETEFKTLALTEEIGATSLFANIGCGTSLLEEFTKIRITLANELKPRRVACHKRLFPNCEIIEGSIDDKDIFDKIVASHKAHNNELVFISCPCQDASSYNTAKSKGKGERSALFKVSLDYIEETNPKYIVFENVALWLTSRPEYAKDILKDKTIGEYVVDELNRMGYNVTSGILSAADYETAENRERAIILACKKELGIWKFPKKHKFRPTVYEVIGLMKSIEAGEYDPENIWHYGLPLENHEIEFLSHTPVGASAWNNSKKYQPKNKDGSPAGAEFKATYTRINPAFPCPVIESGSGQIGDVYSVHFGRPLSDGVFSDSRVLSIAEILRIIGLKDNFLDPLIDTEYSEDMDNNQRGLFFENNMLLRSDETFIREAIGEHVCPKFMLNLVSTMPIPSNDNIK